MKPQNYSQTYDELLILKNRYYLMLRQVRDLQNQMLDVLNSASVADRINDAVQINMGLLNDLTAAHAACAETYSIEMRSYSIAINTRNLTIPTT